MRLRVMTDTHSAFLFDQEDVKAFATETRDGVYWGIMPNGPSGSASTAESAIRQIVAALEAGEDRGLAAEEVTEQHLPPIRSRTLTFVGYFDVGAPESGVRAVARRLSDLWLGRTDHYVATSTRGGVLVTVYGPFRAKEAEDLARKLPLPVGYRNVARRYTEEQLGRLRVPVIRSEHARRTGQARTTAFEEERAELKAFLDARSPYTQAGKAPSKMSVKAAARATRPVGTLRMGLLEARAEGATRASKTSVYGGRDDVAVYRPTERGKWQMAVVGVQRGQWILSGWAEAPFGGWLPDGARSIEKALRETEEQEPNLAWARGSRGKVACVSTPCGTLGLPSGRSVSTRRGAQLAGEHCRVARPWLTREARELKARYLEAKSASDSAWNYVGYAGHSPETLAKARDGARAADEKKDALYDEYKKLTGKAP